ncbi:MAG: IclR family transcriptional regulator C-terminal domain-containing protein [Mycetocola sp.]
MLGSVRRALALVDIVANASRPMPVKALAQASGLTLGTTYNIVRTLIHEGYLWSEPDGLVLGRHFPSLRARKDDGVFLARVRTALNEVTVDLGTTSYLSRFDDGEVHIVDIVDAVDAPPREVWVGVDNGAHASALGKRILGELDPDDRLDYLSRHPLEERTPNTIRDPQTLLRHLEQHPVTSIDREEFMLGFKCLAVPVRAPGIVASLAVSSPVEIYTPDMPSVIQRLRTTAARLSLQLGADRLAASEGFSI